MQQMLDDDFCHASYTSLRRPQDVDGGPSPSKCRANFPSRCLAPLSQNAPGAVEFSLLS
jgi:hypothetical protein